MSTLLDLEPTSERSETTPAGHRRRSRQAKCLVSGGVVFAVGNALHPLEHTDAAYQAATWEAAHLVILASIPLLVLGLPVVHRMLRGRVSDRWALLPVVSVMVGLIGIAPGAVIEAFVAPRVGNAAMDELASGGMGIVPQQGRRGARRPVGLQDAPQVGHVRPHRHLGPSRRVVTPQRVHEGVDGHHAAGLQRQHREQGALAHRAELHRLALPLGHDRAEHPARHRHRAMS